ncbi:sugar isomerase domain-containing protein [Thermoanaerobacter thermocopriae]|uniref:sugar isomerase domain-containing protein n=1 Tax=Thermoanaerobacter thermocopriae TaxID=29350 RepID=UPI00048CDF42|nr:SIS domain-containing protein [Thermoanaerobacter thermocopriae]
MMERYLKTINELLGEITRHEQNKLKYVAEKIADTIPKGAVVHLFGAGHSHILSEDVFYRAGGLVPINPIFDENLMLHNGALRSSHLERMSNYAHTFMESQDIQPGEVFIVFSNSGRNGVPIDVALYAKNKQAFVVGVTSMQYSVKYPSRHVSGKKLYEVVDVYIDNHCPPGDALFQFEGLQEPYFPGSTIAGSFIIQSILAMAIEKMVENDYIPPILLSGNIDGADMHNKKLIEKYKKRIIYYY